MPKTTQMARLESRHHDCPLPSFFWLHWAPAFCGIRYGGADFIKKILPALLQVLGVWPYLIHISSQILLSIRAVGIYQKTSLVSLHLLHKNDIYCLAYKQIQYAEGPLSPTEKSCFPPIRKQSVHTQNPEGLIRF